MAEKKAKLSFKCWGFVLILCTVSIAHANNNYLVAPSGGDITGAELSQQLASGDVKLKSSAGSTTGLGDIIISDAVSWTTNNTLTLEAANSVIVKSSITVGGDTAGLIISPKTTNGSQNATTTGTFSLNRSVINLTGSTPVLTISGRTYTVINTLGLATDATTPPAVASLQSMAATANLAGNYALGSNIDASATASWNSNTGFTAIGSASNAFTGKLNGLGHAISNLSIQQASNSAIGLFGLTSSAAEIRNVGLDTATVNGQSDVGALVGNNAGLISQCYANSSSRGGNKVGSLVGVNLGGTIELSYASGQVNASSGSAGSLAGENSGVIKNCYATGDVYSAGTNTTKGVGGLVGKNNSSGAIASSYSTGSVGSDNSLGSLGGLVGIANSNTVTSSYWDTETSGQSTSSGGSGATGLTTAEMKQQTNFAGFDFTNIWTIVEGQTFPLLKFERSNIIYNVDQLQLIISDLSGSYQLGADIDASATSIQTDVWGGDGFDPIGTESNPFTGSLEGNGFTISNLMINLPSGNNVGLFGYTSSTATITNLGMKNPIITGQNNVGTLVGNNNGSIRSAFAEGINVTGQGGSSSGVGGLVGISSGSIHDSYTSGNLTGLDDVGGLVGINSGQIEAGDSQVAVTDVTGSAGGLVGINQQAGRILASYTSGTVSGVGTDAMLGGLVGTNSGSLSFSNALGQVDCSSGSICGGLVGQNGSSGSTGASISDTYATGSVNGGGANVGGLVGVNLSENTVERSYATVSLSSTTNAGGLIGNNSGTISDSFWNMTLVSTGVSKGSSTGATGLSADEMRISSNFTNFSITTSRGEQGWVVINTDGSLQTAASGTAAATSPMLATEFVLGIKNSHQLQLMVMDLDNNYSLINDVDMTRTASTNDVWGTLGFVPAGSSANPFSGSFDGQQNRINKLNINQTSDNAGLFGYVNSNATISNVKLLNARVLGGNNVGGLAGTLGGTASNIFVNGHMAGYNTFRNSKGDKIGGLVGYNTGSISYCVSTGISYGGRDVGGLVGYNTGSITNCSSSSHTNARGRTAGGLVGHNEGNISNTFVNGDVISASGAGGLVDTNNGSISNSYARNNILKSNRANSLGGLVGLKNPGSSVRSSYWDTTSSGQTTSAAGTGLDSAQMKSQSSFSGWDFTNTWQMDPSYPVLRNMPTR